MKPCPPVCAETLAALHVADDDARLELLRAQLRRVKREVEERFPAARDIVREGLDDAQHE